MIKYKVCEGRNGAGSRAATVRESAPPGRWIALLAGFALLQASGIGAAQDLGPVPADYGFIRLVAEAVRRQPDFGSQEASVSQARGSLTAVKADFLPRVQLLVDSGEDRNRRGGQDVPASRRSGEINPQLTLTQLIYDGGASFGRYRAARERVGSATFGIDAVANNLALHGVQIYLMVLRQREAVRIARENLEKIVDVRDKVAGRVAEGRDPRSEQSRLDSRVLEARGQLTDAQRDLADASANYDEFFGTQPGELAAPVSYPVRRERVDDALAHARKHNPELHSLRSESEASHADLRAERAAMLWPRLFLEVTGTAYDALGSDGMRDRDTYIGLRVSYDVFSGGASLGRTAQASGRQRAAQLAVERAELALDRGLRQAYAAVAARESQIQTTAERMDRDRQAIDDYEELFLAGRRSLNDLIVAQRDYYTSAMQWLDVQLDLNVQRHAVAALTGELAGYFGLEQQPATAGSGGEEP